MAAYHRVDDLTVTCRLTACTPGSAPGPTLGIEYGKPLPLPFITAKATSCGKVSRTSVDVCRRKPCGKNIKKKEKSLAQKVSNSR